MRLCDVELEPTSIIVLCGHNLKAIAAIQDTSLIRHTIQLKGLEDNKHYHRNTDVAKVDMSYSNTKLILIPTLRCKIV